MRLSPSKLVLVVSYLLFINNKAFVHSLRIRRIMGQAISSTQFYLYGRKHFTKTGYLKHMNLYKSPVQTSSGIVLGEEGSDGVESLRDKVIIVTGANSGLGKEVATYAAAHGAKLYMLCRSKDRAETARQEIQTLSKNNNVQVILADVSELSQVRRAAAEIQAKESKIHALVCNAGVLLNDKKMSSEGYETTFASHLLGGTYLLSQLLIPQLEAADNQDGRVVIVTSGGMYNFPVPKWSVLTGQEGEYNGVNAYAFAKRGQVVLAEEMSKQQNNKITWVTAHPGWAATNAVDEAFGDQKKYLEPLREAWQGAEGVAWLLHASNLQSGSLYLDRAVQPKHLAGPFFSEGSFTKNTPEQVNEFMVKMKEATGL